MERLRWYTTVRRPVVEGAMDLGVPQDRPEASDRGESRTGLLRGILVYGSSHVLSNGLSVVRGFLVAAVLGPSGYGAWSLFRLAMPFASLGDFGVRRGMEYVVARVCAGSTGEEEVEEEEFGATALGFILLVFVPVGLLIAAAGVWVPDRTWSLGLLAFGAALPAEQVWKYGLRHLQARQRTGSFSTLEVLGAAGHAFLAVGLALVWGLGGCFLGFSVASVLGVGLLWRQAPLRPGLRIERLKSMLRVGFPVLLALIPSTLLATVDRWVVAAWGGTKLLGFYAFAVAVAGLGYSAVRVLRTLIFPAVYGDSLRHGEEAAIREHLECVIRPFAWIVPPVLGIIALTVGPAVRWLLPSYVPAVAPARIFLFTSIALGLNSLGTLGVVAAGCQERLPPLSWGAVGLNLLLSVLALKLGYGLEAVAAAALVSQGMYAVAVVALAREGAGLDQTCSAGLTAVVPMAYCAGSVFLLGRLVGTVTVGAFVLSLGVYVLTLIPILPRALRELRKLERQGFFSLAGSAPNAVSGGTSTSGEDWI